MKKIYSFDQGDELWMIREPEWRKSLQNIRESQFALSNGYIGSRGILEEIPHNSMPGTFIAGIYDRVASQVAELVNLPNPVNFRLSIGGEKVDVEGMDILSHSRALNTKKALLVRDTLYRDRKKRRYHYESQRFISMHNKNIGVMQIAFTPIDDDCELDIHTGINTSIFNKRILSEGKKTHFKVRELGQHANAGYLAVDTFEKEHTIIYWSGFYYAVGSKKIYAADNVFRIGLKKNKTIIFTKVFFIKHFSRIENISRYKKETFKIFNKAFKSSFSSLLCGHIKSWEKLWEKADIVIEGSQPGTQQNLRFNIYHMLSCGHYDDGFSSIGARTLSGEGYRGHIFWDAEIFLMPFYLFMFPEMAKNMLLYRYKRLDKSRELAAKEGYKGAKFAWESAGTGDEETPEWARDIDRSIIHIHTHKWEHHITADVAYAVYKYYVATSDEKFMLDYGCEIMFETARFWASRVSYNNKKGKYEIKNVIGPDEFHINVNNNAFTNMMAKWNLITACKIFNKFKKGKQNYRKLCSDLTLSVKEVKEWKRIASLIPVNMLKNNVIEQFDGYFKLKDIPLNETDEYSIPYIPSKVKVKDLGKTRIVKQADVLMLLYLLEDVFVRKTKKANWLYYMPRTVHKSSLSSSIHSILACESGDLNRAYNLFMFSLRADISDLHGNTDDGIHAACLGGVWQAMVFGFAGIKITKENLCISPRMPRSWKKIIFSFLWKGVLLKFEVSSASIKVKTTCSKKCVLKFFVSGKEALIKTNRTYLFKRPSLARREENY